MPGFIKYTKVTIYFKKVLILRGLGDFKRYVFLAFKSQIKHCRFAEDFKIMQSFTVVVCIILYSRSAVAVPALVNDQRAPHGGKQLEETLKKREEAENRK